MTGLMGLHADKFSGVSLRGDTLSYKGESRPVAGAHATVDTAGEIDKRFTATRLLLTGPLALAWRKKTDKRELYLAVEGQGFAWAIDLEPKDGKKARLFAAKINGAASQASLRGPTNGPPPPGPPPPPPPPPTSHAQPDVIGLIKQIGELKDRGVLTESEFETKKAELLARL